MLALARALVARPRLLMLDEPSLGLAPTVVQELFRIVKRAERRGGADRARRRAERERRARRVARARTCSRSARSRSRATSDELRRARGRPQVVPGLLMVPLVFTWPTSSSRSSSGLATGVDLREPRARARPDLPDDGRRQLRAGRDGDVHDVHRVVADGPRRVRTGRRSSLTLADRVRRRRRGRAGR